MSAMPNEPYHTRYAMTEGGPVRIRTRRRISAARARLIAAEHGRQVRKFMRLVDTLGWDVPTIHDESIPDEPMPDVTLCAFHEGPMPLSWWIAFYQARGQADVEHYQTGDQLCFA